MQNNHIQTHKDYKEAQKDHKGTQINYNEAQNDTKQHQCVVVVSLRVCQCGTARDTGTCLRPGAPCFVIPRCWSTRIDVTLTSVLHLDYPDALGGSEDVHHGVEGLDGGDPLGGRAHVLPVDDDVHVGQVLPSGHVQHSDPAASGRGRQRVALIQVVQNVAVASGPAPPDQLVPGDPNVLDVQVRVCEESLWPVVVSSSGLPSPEPPAAVQSSISGLLRNLHHLVVVASDGENPAVPRVRHVRDGVFGYSVQAPGVDGGQAHPEVAAPAQLLVLDLDEEDLPGLQRVFAETHSVGEALHARGLGSRDVQSDVGAVDRVEFHELVPRLCDVKSR
ncbi:hypothetical protein EYF80_034876 [Liparis tanakae]|uniref:Uncharacterized protein n=1 Tax=Liparis tanakae TaxID=230148 RepID=A0A4Z2GNS0_9TELE|nr:hypothetical protein EYF80_034876 [Liparis tanakae]